MTDMLHEAGLTLEPWSLPLTGALLLLAMVVAYLLGRNWAAHHAGNPLDNPVLSGMFGLLALLMAFALSLAIGRFEERRRLVVAEANAISTMDTNLALLSSKETSSLKPGLAEYAAIRVAVGNTADDTAWQVRWNEGNAQRARFGKDLFAILRSGSPDTRTPLLAQSYSAMGDAATMRHAARQAHLPAEVLVLLGLYCLAAAGVLGSAHAHKHGSGLVGASLLLALLASAFVVILDLDQPRRGTIIVPQDELAAVAAQLDSQR
ncbi:hypothetical protein [Novosphingobium sp.]|uniref:bestrophin-like domain n=1 Tax=Novosphingobium sp. TaxID=1874826 RepID=UPI0038B6BEE5